MHSPSICHRSSLCFDVDEPLGLARFSASALPIPASGNIGDELGGNIGRNIPSLPRTYRALHEVMPDFVKPLIHRRPRCTARRGSCHYFFREGSRFRALCGVMQASLRRGVDLEVYLTHPMISALTLHGLDFFDIIVSVILFVITLIIELYLPV